MSLRYIHILDRDPTAALVTQLVLQSRLRSEASVTVAAFGPDRQYNTQDAIDLLIVDPGAQNQAATRLIRMLRQDRPETPMLVLTAYDSPLLRHQMRELGVQHYLAKPVDLADLVEVVREALDATQAAPQVAAQEVS